MDYRRGMYQPIEMRWRRNFGYYGALQVLATRRTLLEICAVR